VIVPQVKRSGADILDAQVKDAVQR